MTTIVLRPSADNHLLAVCHALALSHDVDPTFLRVLGAFAPDAHRLEPLGGSVRDSRVQPSAADISAFAELESTLLDTLPALRSALLRELVPHVPRARAQDHERRMLALLQGLAGMRTPAARILRLGFLVRLTQVLAEPRRRPARVRDLLDFYLSQASVLLYARAELPSHAEQARAAEFRRIDGDIEFAQLQGHSSIGPMRLSVLRARSIRLRAYHRAQPDVPFAEFVRASGAMAGISGGYVLCSEMDIEPPSAAADPVGLLVQAGAVRNPPVFRRACLYDGPSGAGIAVVGPIGMTVALADRAWTIAAHNDLGSVAQRPVAFNRLMGPSSPPHDGWTISLLGRTVLQVGRGSLPIPKAGMVLTLPADAHLPAEVLRPGAMVQYRLPLAMDEGMAAGPVLLRKGRCQVELAAEEFAVEVPPYTFAADETRGQNLLPRMVAGMTAAGELVLVAVDGRSFRYGIGMTLHQAAQVLQALGCVIGMNLDGGDSKRMAVAGRLVDLPGSQPEWDDGAMGEGSPTATELRPVYSSLLLYPRDS